MVFCNMAQPVHDPLIMIHHNPKFKKVDVKQWGGGARALCAVELEEKKNLGLQNFKA